MNISQPVTSHVTNVSFSRLSTEDIRALSVRRITNSTTFDTLLNPIPGGLYTPELGQFGDNACSTCGLKTPQCSGHPGHIELPVPCYHPTFIDQVLRLLRAACVYCGKLKLQRVIVNRYVCQLRLVQHGLLNEMEELEETIARAVHNSKGGRKPVPDGSDISDDGDDADAKSIIDSNERFVRRAIKAAKRTGTLSTHKTEAVNVRRRLLVQEIMQNLVKGKKCGNCGGINHAYRKDRAVKIFRKNLTEKEHVAMVQAGIKPKDPVIEQRRQARRDRRRNRKNDEDEGVADLDTPSGDEGADMASSSEEEPEIVGGTMLDEATETASKGESEVPIRKEEYLNPSRVLAQLAQLFEADAELLSLLYGADPRDPKDGKRKVSADMFFIHNLLVPPNRYRPAARTGNGALAEASENTTYRNILKGCDAMVEIQRELTGKDSSRDPRYRPRTYFDFENNWLSLQESVNSLVDRNLSLQNRANMRLADGVKQKLEKKEGMFRQFMMGKRVNFAARTVLSPDPNIETNEIGVPPVFAMTLTYPEPVTRFNLEELQEAVRNGPRVWPGAIAIEGENGSVISLERKNADERTALANQLAATTSTPHSKGDRPKKVHRHLNNGDIVIMNRQPTLHKPSMMCHRARVLPGEKTLRMHYANCNTYNADFDGDEMNMHFPQNELARAEALSIADTDHQYLSGTAGKPLRGLIQDHISMCVWLTSRDMFFDKGDYMNLLYSALRPESNHCISGRLETCRPAILKPRPLWTGKQVISSVLKNLTPPHDKGLTMTGKSTTESVMWGEAGREENVVIFLHGDHLQGILDKKQIGPSDGGLVNAVYEAYGHTVAGKLLSVLGRLLTRLLHMRAFSCGVEDVVFNRQGEAERRSALAGADAIGLEVAAQYVSLADQNPKSGDQELQRRLEDVLRDDEKQAGLDSLTNQASQELSRAVSSACMPVGLSKPFPKNQMQTMTTSGAKGSKVNANLISCNLGQQVLEGRRVPVMVSGKTLPCFKPFESNIRAGGFVVDRFLTGIRPQEYFFHTMAGREGLIDTAVKTSRSGYLQRCLIKGMEGLRVEHDTSVRDVADGSMIQFIYGEDGLDVAKSKYMYDFKFAAENVDPLVRAFNFSTETISLTNQEAKEHTKKAMLKYRKTGDLGASDPALSLYPPSKHLGSISERIFAEGKQWVDENKERLIKDKKKNIEGELSKKVFTHLLDIRYLRSLVEAGEAVGVVAGQSVGEPSTQMTLNTFHLAGHAAKNVTLGIPRLREIVMTAAPNPSTPTMALRLQAGISVEQAKKFAKGISRLSLAELIDKVSVSESTGKGVAFPEAKMYKIRLDLFPATEYQKEHAIQIHDVVNTIEQRLLPRLQAVVRKELKRRGDVKKSKETAASDALPDIGQSVGRSEQETVRPAAERGEDDEESDADSDAEDDATGDKTRHNRRQAGYDAYEDDEERAIAADNREATPETEFEDEAYGGSPRASPEPSDEDEEEHGLARAVKAAAVERQTRIKANQKTNDVVNFSFDDAKGAYCSFTFEYESTTSKLLMLHLVESALRASLIQSVAGISACILDEEATKKQTPPVPILSASGVNIPALWEYSHVIHPDYLYTNSVYAMLMHYGVEAARATIVRELQAVFGGHGISVDPRHLTLIADYQTRAGGYQAFSRIGYRANPSPFMKMSFETTLGFVRDAVLEADADPLMNPSARIVTGRLGKMGTGGFDVLMPLAGSLEEVNDEEVEEVESDGEEGAGEMDNDVEMNDQ